MQFDPHFFLLLVSSCFPNGLQSSGSAINFYFPFRDIFSLNFALEICCHLCALLKTIESSLILSFILQWAMRALTNSSNSSFSSSIYGHPLHHPPRQKSICWWPWHWTCGRSGNQKEANGGWKWYQGKGFGTNFKYFLAIGESQQVQLETWICVILLFCLECRWGVLRKLDSAKNSKLFLPEYFGI